MKTKKQGALKQIVESVSNPTGRGWPPIELTRIVLSPACGGEIGKCCDAAAELANREDVEVFFVHNGAEVIARPGMTSEVCYQQWQMQMTGPPDKKGKYKISVLKGEEPNPNGPRRKPTEKELEKWTREARRKAAE